MTKRKVSSVVVSTDEIKQSVTDLITKPIEEVRDPDPEPAPGNDPKDTEEWSFMFEHKDVPLESIDGGMLALNEAIAHMTFSLQELPSWAEDLRQLHDAAIIFALWENVRSHETRYFRLDSGTSTTKEK